MSLGRKQRTASEAQRVALIARDQHCVGCGANPLWCRAHHIIWWSKNGPTDIDNLVLVCDDCHHKIHDHDWQIYKHPETGKYHLKPPNPNQPNQNNQTTSAQGTRKPARIPNNNTNTPPAPVTPTCPKQKTPTKPEQHQHPADPHTDKDTS